MRSNQNSSRTACLVILQLVFILLVSGCRMSTMSYIDFRQPAALPAKSSDTETAQRPLLIAFATVLSPQETFAQYRQIANYLSYKTGRPAILVQRRTYEEVNMLLSNGDVDIAFMSTGAYSSYKGMNEIELLVMAEYGGNTMYNAEVIVHKDSNFNTINDLQGKVFTFTDPLSYSGHMVIENYLRRQNALPETFFKRYFYTYSHDRSLWAVANKVADGASVDSQILEYAKARTPEIFDKVRIIATIGPAPTGPIVVKKTMNLQEKEQIRSVFLTMHNDPPTAAAMKKIIIDRFVEPTPESYEPLQNLYTRTKMI